LRQAFGKLDGFIDVASRQLGIEREFQPIGILGIGFEGGAIIGRR